MDVMLVHGSAEVSKRAGDAYESLTDYWVSGHLKVASMDTYCCETPGVRRKSHTSVENVSTTGLNEN